MLETTTEVTCPYCGETLTLFLDLSIESQSYIEDCTVCCQPMSVTCSASKRVPGRGIGVIADPTYLLGSGRKQ